MNKHSRRILHCGYLFNVCFLAFGCGFLLVDSAWATEPKAQIDIENVWVEDGYIFHVDFEVLPYHVDCPTDGAGYIGFNIYYKDTGSSKEAWTFGLAPWPDGPVSDAKYDSHLTAYGPQAFCSVFSPCLIQDVKMVKKWCPIP